MEQIIKINHITCEIEIEENATRKHLTTFSTIEKMIDYMTSNDVIYKGANIGNDFYIVRLEKTDQANENWYENEMRTNKYFPDLPTNMYK